MPSYNHCVLVGNLTRDPELKYIPSGTAVCNISLAINERYKVGDEWKEKAVFVECTAWGKTAEVANEYLVKGSPVLIDGRLDFQQWEKDGQKRSKLLVMVNKLQLIGSKGERKTKSEPQDDPDSNYNQSQDFGPPGDESDIPF